MTDDDSRMITAAEAELEFGVPQNTLKQWVHREKLAPVVRGKRPHLFYAGDVERCLDASPRRLNAAQAAQAWRFMHRTGVV